MKRQKINMRVIWTLVVFFVGLILGKYITFAKFFSFLNLPAFSSLVTFFVGGFAIYLYKKQQRDYKINAAILILQEIRYAEDQIRNAKMINQDNYYLANRLLPTNNWNKNIHLFIKDFSESDQVDIISRFYSQAAYMDKILGIISDEKSRVGFHQGEPTADKKILSSGYVFEKGVVMFDAVGMLKDVSQKIEFIYNSPAVDKLRSIANGDF